MCQKPVKKKYCVLAAANMRTSVFIFLDFCIYFMYNKCKINTQKEVKT